MATLVWDKIGTHFYETGIDRAVLYLPDGNCVPWNGLISVTEQVDGTDGEAIYFDGVKFAEVSALGDFSASVKAYTYPDEFLEFEGILEIGNGLFISEQPKRRFGLSYRSKIGNDLDSALGYKIHVLYNLTAVPSAKTYQTMVEGSAIEFEWTMTAIPDKVPGFRPTAHLVFDTRLMGPYLLEDIEDTLYGNNLNDARLPSISTLTSFVSEWVILRITDNYDGTWSATGPDEMIKMLDATTFQIIQANAEYLDSNTYKIGSLTY